MDKFNPFLKADQRLRAALERARTQTDPQKATKDLHTVIESTATEVAKTDQNLVATAYTTLADLQARVQPHSGEAVHTLDDLRRRYPFARATATNAGLALAKGVQLNEHDLLTIGEWLREAGGLADLATALAMAVDHRFQKSVRLAMLLGDALVAKGQHAEAAQRFISVYHFFGEATPDLVDKLAPLAIEMPKDIVLRRSLGLILFSQRKYAEAATHLQATYDLGDHDTHALRALAESLLELRRRDDAVGILEHLLQEPGSEVDIFRLSGRIVDEEKTGAPARWKAERAWGDALCHQARFDEALDHFRSALKDVPNDTSDCDFAATISERLFAITKRLGTACLAEGYLALGQANLLAGKPEMVQEPCVAAVQADRSTLARAISSLHQASALAPGLLPLRLQLADFQIQNSDWAAALAILETTRAELPARHKATLPAYRSLLKALTATTNDGALAVSAQAPVLRDVLFAIAEETASGQPDEAIAHLERALRALGSREADAILAMLSKLGLCQASPLTSHLLMGDALMSKGAFDGALHAYKQAPLTTQSVEAICQRLDGLAQADAKRPDALLAAGQSRLHMGDSQPAVPLFQRAFERSNQTSAPVIVIELSALRKANTCSKDGLLLLTDALIHLADGPSLSTASEICRDLLTTGAAAGTVARLQAICRKTAKETLTFAQASLLLGDALAQIGQFDGAAGAYAAIAGHPKSSVDTLIDRLRALTTKAPQLTAAWLVLGDMQQLKGPAHISDTLTAYEAALKSGPAKAADAVIERLANVKTKGPNASRVGMLKAEALAAGRQLPAAYAEAHSVLRAFGAAAKERIVAFCEETPAGIETPLLRAEVDLAQQRPDLAMTWFSKIIESGQDSHVTRALERLRAVATQFPESADVRLGIARCLIRLKRCDEAASELAQVTEAFPEARGAAASLLDGILRKTATPAIWMNRAYAFIVEDNTSAAVDALSHAVTDNEKDLWLPIYDRLRVMAALHPADAGVLRGMVHLEIRLAGTTYLDSALDHAAAWLQVAPQQADEIAAVLVRINDLAGVQGLAPALALRAQQTCADALFTGHHAGDAAAKLRQIVTRWPDESSYIVQRCQQALVQEESLDVRLLLVDTHLVRHELTQALDVCRCSPGHDTQTCQACAERCQQLIAAATPDTPALGVGAAMALAQYHAWQLDAAATAAACQTGFRLAPDRLPDICVWLEENGWDDESRRIFRYAEAEMLLAAGGDRLDQAITVYRVILELGISSQSGTVLQMLARFPEDYLPAHLLALDIYLWLGPPYDNAYAKMTAMLPGFVLQHAAKLLSVCDHMEQDQPGVSFMRAQILEAAGDTHAAAQALLNLQTTQLEQAVPVQEALQGLIRRYPDPHLVVMLGDSYAQAEQWDAAVDAYRQAHAASAGVAPILLERYLVVLSHISQSIGARWGLAQAYLTLQQPDAAIPCIDEITDHEPSEAEQATTFLDELLRLYPACGAGWYERGKLHYRVGECAAIDRFERALTEGGVPEVWRTALHDMLGHAYERVGQLEPALANMRRAVHLSPDDPGLRRSLLTIRVAMLDRRIAAAEIALVNGPDDKALVLALVDLLQQRGRFARATAILQAALTTASERAILYVALARSFSAQQLYHLAASSLDAALATDELTTDQRKEALLQLATAFLNQLRYDDAVNTLERLCTMDMGYKNILGMINNIQREKVLATQQTVALHPIIAGPLQLDME